MITKELKGRLVALELAVENIKTRLELLEDPGKKASSRRARVSEDDIRKIILDVLSGGRLASHVFEDRVLSQGVSQVKFKKIRSKMSSEGLISVSRPSGEKAGLSDSWEWSLE